MQNGIGINKNLMAPLPIKQAQLKWENSEEDKEGFVKKSKDLLIYQQLMNYFNSMSKRKIKLKQIIHQPLREMELQIKNNGKT